MHEALRAGIDPVPSRSGIYRALKRPGLIDPRPPTPGPKFKRWERGGPMELWQMDVVGGVLLADGTEAKVLTGIDDHSRFVVCAGLMTRATVRAVCGHFAEALRRYGVPQEVLTDNGKVFTGRFGRNDTEVLFDRICRENGIDHLLTAPRSPRRPPARSSGSTARFAWSSSPGGSSTTWPSRRASSMRGSPLQHRATARGARHGDARQSVPPPGRRPPARDDSALGPERSGDDWITRRVSANGVISVAWQQICSASTAPGAASTSTSTGPTCRSGTATNSSRPCCEPATRRSARSAHPGQLSVRR